MGPLYFLGSEVGLSRLTSAVLAAATQTHGVGTHDTHMHSIRTGGSSFWGPFPQFPAPLPFCKHPLKQESWILTKGSETFQDPLLLSSLELGAQTSWQEVSQEPPK